MLQLYSEFCPAEVYVETCSRNLWKIDMDGKIVDLYIELHKMWYIFIVIETNTMS